MVRVEQETAPKVPAPLLVVEMLAQVTAPEAESVVQLVPAKVDVPGTVKDDSG